MNKTILLISIILSGTKTYSQNINSSNPEILHSKNTGYLSYVGRMNNELWLLLNEQEIELYDSCLSRLNLSRETVKWYSQELFSHLITDNYYCSIKIVSLKTDPLLNSEEVISGKNKLNSPECILVITRIPGSLDEVAIHMYF